MFFFIPDLFTPYIEGREKAIDRNWKDQQNFYQVQKNQLSNLYDLGTLSQRINQQYEKTTADALKNRQSAREDWLREQMFPGLGQVAAAQGQMMGNNAALLAENNIQRKYGGNDPNSSGDPFDINKLMQQVQLYRQMLEALKTGGTGTQAAGTGTAGAPNATGAMDIPAVPDPNAAKQQATGTGNNAAATGPNTSAEIPSILQQNNVA